MGRKGKKGGGGEELTILAIIALLLLVAVAIAIPLVLPIVWLAYEARRHPTPPGPDPFALTAEERGELNYAEKQRRASAEAHRRLRSEARGFKKRSDGKLDGRNHRARELNEDLPDAALAEELDADLVDELSHRPIVRWNQWAAVLRDRWGMRIALVLGVGTFVLCAAMRWTRYLDFLSAEGGGIANVPKALWSYARALADDLPGLREVIAVFAPAGATLLGFSIGRAVGMTRAAAIIPIPPVARPTDTDVTDSAADKADVEHASASPSSASTANVASTKTEAAADSSESTRGLDISGTWSTEYVYRGETSKIAMELTQQGARISGTSGKSKISGELSGRVFVGQWKEGRAKGGLRFEFSDDGQRFDGSWNTDGEPESGSWNGARES